MDYSKIDNIEFSGIDPNDHPKYCDAYIIDADYKGKGMSEKQLDEINGNSDFVHEKLCEFLY